MLRVCRIGWSSIVVCLHACFQVTSLVWFEYSPRQKSFDVNTVAKELVLGSNLFHGYAEAASDAATRQGDGNRIIFNSMPMQPERSGLGFKRVCHSIVSDSGQTRCTFL